MKLHTRILLALMGLVMVVPAFGQRVQSLKGVVFASTLSGKEEPVPFASVYWLESGTYMDCDENGAFEFMHVKENDATLVATAIGYTRDTVVVQPGMTYVEFHLTGINELAEAVVVSKQEGNYLSRITPVKTEVITAAGLCKMACCNLAESFENSASVTVGYSDAITGAKQIRLLGLSGIYTQMLDENRPVMRGLASPFGLSYIPGQWLESIQIAKGPSSVINGVEAITGQINMEHRKPTAEQPLFINLFLSDMLRTEANIASSLQLNEKWSTVMMGHVSTDPMSHDSNKDGFRDEPQTLQFNIGNRWLYYDESGMQIRFGFRALKDDRIGGMMDYDPDNHVDLDETAPWGSHIVNEGVSGFFKVGVPLNAENSRNVAVVGDYTYHKLDSRFGNRHHFGNQNSAFLNIMYQDIPNDSHRFTFGIRNQYDLFDETLDDVVSASIRGQRYNLGREENQIGVYGEYTYSLGEKLTAVVDFSADYNNLHGWLFSPRANVKYAFTDALILRASGGRGFRSSNVIVDNLGMMSTGRLVRFGAPAQPQTDASFLGIEDAWTYGGNLTGYLPWGYDESAYISFDYFRSQFVEQVIVDQEWQSGETWIYNLSDLVNPRSYTNTYQVDFSIYPIERFNILATFRYTDSKVTLRDRGLVERPLVSRYKGVLNLQYATRMNIWTFDFTAQINGPSRLPDFAVKAGESAYSPVYPMLFAQITRKFSSVDVYVGAENLTNYKQKNPIIDAANPYGADFNSSVIWGPLMGIKVYAGLRFTLWK